MNLREAETALMIAVINPDKCKPKKCRQECKRICPVNQIGRICIDVLPTSNICIISERLCIGCG
jgi:ATP-binding cassette, sub-family E, member 1